jgi:hypothetical protein
MPIVSQGQITIVDYNDAVTLTGFIGANHPLTQIYNPDNGQYSPDYASSNLVLTPSLFLAGSSSDIITSTNVQSIKWYDASAPTTELTNGTTYGLPAFTSGQNRPLTIKQNVLSGSTTSKTYICEIVYRDPSTGLDITYKTSITIQRINNGGGVTVANVTTPNGNAFKNNTGSSLTAKAELLRSTGVDTTNVTYQWYIQKTGNPDEGAGAGWDKLDATTNYGTSGYTTDTLTVPASAVNGIATFKCVITDTDTASPTYNQKFSGTVTFVDLTDPIQVVVFSSGGDVFKNGVGTTTLTAKLFQGGVEVDTGGSQYTYKWYKYDKNGNQDPNFGGTGINYKTGKSITVGGADVDVKATFVVEIS